MPGIAESVENLASALAAHVQVSQTEDAELLNFLAAVEPMPAWRDRGRLDEWEARAQRQPFNPDAPERNGEPSSLAAWEIFALGRFNLYAAIDAEATKTEFERVRCLLHDAGVEDIARSDGFDFSVW